MSQANRFNEFRELENLSDERIDYLLNLGMESENIDYKEDLDINRTEDIVKIAKDVAAMANSGGGYIIIGVDKNFNKKGIPHEKRIDEAVLRDKINRYFDPPIKVLYREVFRDIDGENKKFGVIYVVPSKEIVVSKAVGNYSKNGITKTEFRENVVLIRDGSKSKPAGSHELRRLMDRQIIMGSAETLQKSEIIVKLLDKRGEPDKVRERLISNVLPVVSLPDTIWYADTDYRDKVEVYKHFEKSEISDIPAFILKEKMLFTFSNLSIDENILRKVIDIENIFTDETTTWTTDEVKRRYLIELLNVSIRDDHCKKVGLMFDGKRKRYYFPILPKGGSRRVSWVKNGKKFTRTIVKWDKRESCYIHDAAVIKFVFIGDSIFLVVDPCIIITYDGITPATDEKAKGIYTKIFNEYYNSKYLTDLNFWISILGGGRSYIIVNGFGYKIKIAALPMTGITDVGIKDESKAMV